jgi:hypothetical protein
MIREVYPDGLISGPLDTYDWLMIAFVIVAIVAFFVVVLYILALPGKIAISRNHPHAETVKLMGYLGAAPVLPWIHAFIWAFHDSVTVDVRRFPKEEKAVIEAEIAKLKAEDAPRTRQVEVQKAPPAPPPSQQPS